VSAAVHGAATRVRLSPSALNRYLVCPKQFLLADIERRPRTEDSAPHLSQANAIHHALERFFGLPLDSREPENLERALRAVWSQHRQPDTFASREEEREYGRAALGMLQLFAASFDLCVQPLAREQWVRLRIDGFEVFGKIDRIDAGRSGGIDILDYKTGTRPLDPTDLASEPAVQVYVLGAERACQQPVERVRFVYLALGTEVVWEPEREDVEALGERLGRTLKAIRTQEVFEAAPGHHCRWCAFNAICTERSATTLDELQPVEGLP
jgi:RecB family exonuclease